MTRRPIIAGNWKMYMLTGPAKELAAALAKQVGRLADRDVVLVPPFTALAAVKEAIAGTNLALGAQNGHATNEGAFTGEDSKGNFVLSLGELCDLLFKSSLGCGRSPL